MHSDSYEPVSPDESNSAVDHTKNLQDVNYRAVSQVEQNTAQRGDGIHQSSQEQKAACHQILAPWYREILACILILGAPLAMMGTLYAHAGQVAPKWPLKITVNALLSIYSVVFRAALGFVSASCIGQLQWTWFKSERPLYDVVRFMEASQGAWGSLCWLYTHHLRQPLTALGSTILILAVALDPFAQQLVRPVVCVQSSGKIATLPRTVYFSDPSDDAEFRQEFGAVMERAVLAPTTGIEAYCPTGNCTFSEPFSTVGYCSRCEDSTAELKVAVRCDPDNHHSDIKNISRSEDCPKETFYIAVSSLPVDNYASNIFDWPGDYNMNVTYKLDDSTRSGFLSGPEMFKMDVKVQKSQDENMRPIRTEITAAKVIAGKTAFSDYHLDVATGMKISACDANDAASDWRCRGYGAATCTISPCVRTYNATVVNGYMVETLISDTGLLKWGGSEEIISLLDTHCATKDERNQLKEMGYKLDSAQRWLPLNATYNPGDHSNNNPLGDVLWRRKCLYSIEGGFATINGGGYDALQTFLVGSVRGIGGGSDMYGHANAPDHFDGELIPKMLYNSGRIDMERIESTFANITESLTRYLRTHGNKNYSVKTFGEAQHQTTCLEVQWLWIIFPAVIAVLTIILLAFVISMSHVHGEPVWKASPLVWIHQSSGLGGGPLPNDGTGTPTLAELERRSKRVPVSVT